MPKKELSELRTILLKIAAVFWFMPIYAGALICVSWGAVKIDHMLDFWLLGGAFEQTVQYASAVFYLFILSYAALTHRVWIPNGFVRLSLQYLFKLPHPKVRKLPAYALTLFPAFTYLFLIFYLVAKPIAGLMPTENEQLQNIIAMVLGMSFSYTLGLIITHKLLKHTHFLKVHALHELEH